MNPPKNCTNTPVLCFGEILWDGLPDGLFLGGAPFNVAYHLHAQGTPSFLISRVGEDFPGREALSRAAASGVNCQFTTTDPEHETGNVRAVLDENKNASYEIAQPVAWDFIEVTDSLRDFAKTCGAIVFGSLAQREAHNREALFALLEVEGPTRILDINLRAPFEDPEVLKELLKRCDFLKLNEDELAKLSPGGETIGCRCRALSEQSNITEICVTLGEKGAFYWSEGLYIQAAAPSVEVKDTVGAGDAFMAALVRAKLGGQVNALNSEWLEFACKVGAFVASQRGATPSYTHFS